MTDFNLCSNDDDSRINGAFSVETMYPFIYENDFWESIMILKVFVVNFGNFLFQSHKSKTKETHDKENVHAQVNDIEVVSDISEDTRRTPLPELKAGETVPKQEKPLSSIQEDRTPVKEGTTGRSTTETSTTESSTTETSTTNAVPGDESFGQICTAEGNTTESCTAEEIDVLKRPAEPLPASTVETCASDPAEASAQCSVECPFSTEHAEIEVHDITVSSQNVALTDVKTSLEELGEASPHVTSEAEVVIIDASPSSADATRSCVSTEAEVIALSDNNVQLSRESQLNGRLGVVLAESFANASAPEQMICMDAVVGQVVETATAYASQLRPSECGKGVLKSSTHFQIQCLLSRF